MGTAQPSGSGAGAGDSEFEQPKPPSALELKAAGQRKPIKKKRERTGSDGKQLDDVARLEAKAAAVEAKAAAAKEELAAAKEKRSSDALEEYKNSEAVKRRKEASKKDWQVVKKRGEARSQARAERDVQVELEAMPDLTNEEEENINLFKVSIDYLDPELSQEQADKYEAMSKDEAAAVISQEVKKVVLKYANRV
jgi:hypothetical protein